MMTSLQSEACFCITRYGTVKMIKSDDNQCKAVGHTDFTFVAKIIVPATNLNPQGFVVDHNNIQREVEYVFKRNAASCEDMAGLCMEALGKLCEDEQIEPMGMYIKISPVSEPSRNRAHMELATHPSMLMLQS